MRKPKGAKLFVYIFCFVFVATQFAFSKEAKHNESGQLTFMSYNLAGPFGITFSLNDIFSKAKKQKITNKNNFGVNYTEHGENISNYNDVDLCSNIIQDNSLEEYKKHNNQKNGHNKEMGIIIKLKINF